jgi:uncharacterized protein YbaA (DUF1428 family)
MKYVDGYVLVIKKGKLAEYKKMAAWGGRIWKKHGALEYFECIGDDMNPAMGGMKPVTFPKMTKAKPGDKIAFSFIIYKNKSHRDSVNKKVFAEMSRNQDKMKNMPMPVDMKKFTFGGFNTIVEERK